MKILLIFKFQIIKTEWTQIGRISSSKHPKLNQWGISNWTRTNFGNFNINRFLDTKLLEYVRSIKNKDNKTALAEHAINYKHNFDFNKTKIWDFENKFKTKINLKTMICKQILFEAFKNLIPLIILTTNRMVKQNEYINNFKLISRVWDWQSKDLGSNPSAVESLFFPQKDFQIH